MLALPGSLSVASTSLFWRAFTTRSFTKAVPIQFIEGRSHMKKRRCCKLPYPVIMHAFHVTCY